MKKCNIKLMTKSELKLLNDIYTFKYIDGGILATTKNYNRKVIHDIDKKFLINSKIRNIYITPQAMKMWVDNFQNSEYTLLDIQNAINSLIISYQNIDKSELIKELNILSKRED